MVKVSANVAKSRWVQETLESLISADNIEDGLEGNNVERIMKPNRASYVTLARAIETGSIGSVSFWVTKKTIDVDFSTVSTMVARKSL
mgnify:CR=1 FL=1|jgi:hypothetical protein